MLILFNYSFKKKLYLFYFLSSFDFPPPTECNLTFVFENQNASQFDTACVHLNHAIAEGQSKLLLINFTQIVIGLVARQWLIMDQTKP